MRSIVLLLLTVSLAVGITEGTLLEGVKSGNVNVKLGDGYGMSFALPDTTKSYDIESESAFNEFLKNKNYYVHIKEAGKDDTLLTIGLDVYPESQFFPQLPEPSRDEIEGFGPSVLALSQIDGEKGSILYNYPSGNPGINPLDASGAAFLYYPQASPGVYNLKGFYHVYADTYSAASRDSRVIPIFEEVLNSIHVSGI